MSLSVTKRFLPASLTAVPILCSHAVLRPRDPYPMAGSRQKYELKRMRVRRKNAPSVPG